MLLDTNKFGLFLTHQSTIALPFVDFVQEGKLNLNEKEQNFIKERQKDFKTVPRPKNQLPHKNEKIGEHVQIEVDLKSLTPKELERLYEASSQKIQAEILKELPELVEKKLIQQFLQCVAYGQQEEAEQILKKNPVLVQRLLTADDIPFTDYSGRTFTCTAYEYAYWACDSHMRWMLEDYILNDEEIRRFIYRRVMRMEERPETGFLSWLFFQARSRGLNYTQHSKSHNSPHFDFKPLINALSDYAKQFQNRSWEERHVAWKKNVGGAQREAPAHLAQEYCHPDRSFKDLSASKSLLNKKPFKREIQFSGEAGLNDVWFPLRENAGLGFSFGVLGTPVIDRMPAMASEGPWTSLVDLSAVKLIEKVRVDELKQSFERLSRPLNMPSVWF